MAEDRRTGQVIVLTGASSGFGKGVARRLAEQGAALALAARRRDLLDILASECERAGGRAIAVATDVSRREDVERLTETAVRQFDRIDVWINNAGIGALGRFDRVPLEDHEQVIRTNLLGTLYGSYFAYQQFLKQRSGILINVASELALYTVPYYSAYAASKHGVVGLGDSLRQEIAQNGHEDIHVCTVMPTAHDTPFFDHAANYTGHLVQPPKPLHDPYDVVDTIVRLVHDPQDEEIVVGDGLAKVLMKRLVPAAQERAAAHQIHETQMEKPPPAVDSANALHAPILAGTEVRAGRNG